MVCQGESRQVAGTWGGELPSPAFYRYLLTTTTFRPAGAHFSPPLRPGERSKPFRPHQPPIAVAQLGKTPANDLRS